jgi:hypothetical protein
MLALIIIFWIHNVIFFLASVSPVLDIMVKGSTNGQLNLIPLILAWIAGALMWGRGATTAGLRRVPKDSTSTSVGA